MKTKTIEKTNKKQRDSQDKLINTTPMLQNYLKFIGQYLNLAQLSNYK